MQPFDTRPGSEHKRVSLADRRRQARRSGLWAVRFETTDGRRFECLVLDLSRGGMKLRLDGPIAAGDILTMIGGRLGRRSARVAWSTENRAGLVFLSEAPHPERRSSPEFLRGRALVLRRLAAITSRGEGEPRLERLAGVLEAQAEAAEQRRWPLTIRRDRRPPLVDQ